MRYEDLRGWLARVEAMGELKRIQGAHWNLEMGGLCEIIYRSGKMPPPAILFDEIEGYPRGYRTLFGQLGSQRRTSLALGIEHDYPPMGFVNALRDRFRAVKPLPPREVEGGPVLENVQTGSAIDLLRFPAPLQHELDGGRYLGSGCIVITRDPDEGWVNLGTYRVMVHDRDTLGIHINPGKQGRIHRDKYFARGEPCPIAVVIGAHPLLWLASTMEIPWGLSEYDFTGGLLGEPIPVMKGPETGLPLPPDAEIVVEGETLPGETRAEGPFGEWAGYYANAGKDPVPEPVIRVKRVMHRNDPILTCAQVSRPPHDYSFSHSALRSANLWDALEKAGVPDIRGVWCPETGGGRCLKVVSIKQRYAGHARQAGALALQLHAGAYVARYAIVVDDDIDPSNTYDVLWALATRSDPERSIDIMRRSWSSSADPAFAPGQKGFNSRAVIDACRPFEWPADLIPVAEVSPTLKAKLLEKFAAALE